MRQSILRPLKFALAALAGMVLIPIYVVAQDIPVIPHPLEGRADCLMCHASGVAGAPQYPADHAGRTNDMCQACHKPAAEAASTALPSVEPSAPLTATEAAPAATASAAPRVPGIPHPLEGRADCLTCHQSGVVGAQKIPADHAGRTDDMCQACHQPTSALPPIPHPLQGRTECLACHETGVGQARQIPPDHGGRTNDTCQDCHLAAAEAAPTALAGVEPTAPLGPPNIPHPLERHTDCVGCHREGAGGAPRFPDDHASRTNDTCQGCHQLAAATPAVPATPVATPISVYPFSEKVNSCRDCHQAMPGRQSDIVTGWLESIHAQRQVGCADCHGGDPSASSKEEAMSRQANYIGVPLKQQIPALCASCHADVTRMRQYDLPTDQFAKYQESIHGMLLLRGDSKVATCYDCHGGHQVLKADDPASSVYPANVPGMCAGCHSDQALMAGREIPTDQFDLYRQSVHGHALLDNADLRAPTCATCHGTHGATPPGVDEVANMCGVCHSATRDYYVKSPHAGTGPGAPECVTCHGRHEVRQPGEDIFVGQEAQHCGACHSPDSGPHRLAQSLATALTGAAGAYDEAEAAVESARAVGILVGPLEVRLGEAKTDLITARAIQHTLDLGTVKERTDRAQAVSGETKASAEEGVAASVSRRLAMIVAVAVIGLIILALTMLKRQLSH